jgi:copper chaperone CopZ
MAAAKPPSDQQVPPGSETLKYQTWVLKVLIHCDGCTKRVKKILQGIEGVYTTEIDSRAHKVTVTGNVAAETLIKKLSRSGKSVELWPEKPPEKKDNKKDKKSSKSKDETENTTNKEKAGQKTTEPVGEICHDDQGCMDDACDDGEEDSDHKEGNNNSNGNGDSNKSEGGAKKKKKKKKKNKSGSSVPPNNGDKEKEIIGTETIDAAVAIPKEIIIPPQPQVLQQHGYNPYQPHMYYSHPPLTPAPPPYGLSYNTSYPVSTTSSYYISAPVMPMHADYARFPPPPPPSHPINNYGHHNDHEEYEGGYCSIM